MTCKECYEELQNLYDGFEEKSTIQMLVDYMVGPAFCETEEDVARCKEVIPALIPLAIPALIKVIDSSDEDAFCQAVLGVC